jgi:hypothetical protein
MPPGTDARDLLVVLKIPWRSGIGPAPAGGGTVALYRADMMPAYRSTTAS